MNFKSALSWVDTLYLIIPFCNKISVSEKVWRKMVILNANIVLGHFEEGVAATTNSWGPIGLPIMRLTDEF